MHHSTKTRDRIFVKVYGFLYFAKNMDKNFGKNKSENLSGKYRQKILNLLQLQLKLLQKNNLKNSRLN